jgi:hypothetical protein
MIARFVFEMLVQPSVVLVPLFVPDGGRLPMRAAQANLPCRLRTHPTQRDQLRQILLPAVGAFRRGRRMQHQILESVATLPTLVFKHWHEQTLNKTRRRRNCHRNYDTPEGRLAQ